MIKLISDIAILEVVMAEEFVSANLLFEFFDALAPVAFPDKVAESTEKLVKLIVVNGRSERHLDFHPAIYLLLSFYDYPGNATAQLYGVAESP